MTDDSKKNLRNFVFTLNNYTDEDIDRVAALPFKYLVFGFEVSETGTPHLQGYCELQKQTKFNTIKELIPRAHIEKRLGTAGEAADYCKKDGDFIEEGTISNPGKRNDIRRIKEIALKHNVRTLINEHDVNLGQIKYAEKVLQYCENQRTGKPHVTWIYGPSGTGKSESARKMLGHDHYEHKWESKWFDGYDGHKSVLLDEFRDTQWSLKTMLGLLGTGPMRVEYKGGSRQFLGERIIITSILPPWEQYLGTGEPIKQLLRRIDVIYLSKSDYSLVPVPVPEVEGNTSVPSVLASTLMDTEKMEEWLRSLDEK